MKSARHTVDIPNATLGKRHGYTAELARIQKDDVCPFCEKNLALYHPKPILYKNTHWLATENAWPYTGTKKHFLLIARGHSEDAATGTPEVWKDLGALFTKIVRKYDLSGATLVMRSGETRMTGASVRHLHAQIMVGSPRTTSSTPITSVVGFTNKKKTPSST